MATDCTDSCKSNYNSITTTTARLKSVSLTYILWNKTNMLSRTMYLTDVLSSVLKPTKHENYLPPTLSLLTKLLEEYQQEVPIYQERYEVCQTRDIENNADDGIWEDPLIRSIKRVLNYTYHYCPTTLLFWVIWIRIIWRRYYNIFSVVLWYVDYSTTVCKRNENIFFKRFELILPCSKLGTIY